MIHKFCEKKTAEKQIEIRRDQQYKFNCRMCPSTGDSMLSSSAFAIHQEVVAMLYYTREDFEEIYLNAK